MSKVKYYEHRWYDGEQEFVCPNCGCREFDYLLDDEDPSTWHTPAGDFFAHQLPPLCRSCNSAMTWTGGSGSTTSKQSIAGALLALLRQRHYLAACVLFSATTEYQLNSLLWAVLVDSGYDRDRASELADGSLSNGEVVRMLRVLLSTNLKTIVLPARNDLVHGRGFGLADQALITMLRRMLSAVRVWTKSIVISVDRKDWTEVQRWQAYMDHWLVWCEQRLSRVLA